MLTQTACSSFKQQTLTAGQNFATDAFKIALYGSTAVLNAQTQTYTPTGEVSGSGYTPGGIALAVSQQPVVDPTTGIVYLSFAPAVFAAAVTARGALIYNATRGNASVCVLDFGADKVSGNTLTVTFPPVGPYTSIIRLV